MFSHMKKNQIFYLLYNGWNYKDCTAERPCTKFSNTQDWFEKVYQSQNIYRRYYTLAWTYEHKKMISKSIFMLQMVKILQQQQQKMFILT